MPLNLRKDKQFVICDDFDGQRRCQSEIFSDFNHVQEKLSELNCKREKQKKENPGWYLEHKVSEFYIVEMSYARVGINI